MGQPRQIAAFRDASALPSFTFGKQAVSQRKHIFQTTGPPPCCNSLEARRRLNAAACSCDRSLGMRSPLSLIAIKQSAITHRVVRADRSRRFSGADDQLHRSGATKGNARGISSGRNSNPRISDLISASPNPVNTKTTTTSFFRPSSCRAGICVTLRIPFSPSSQPRIPNARTSVLSARRLPRSQAGHSVVSSSTQTTRYSSSDGLRPRSIRAARSQSSRASVAALKRSRNLRNQIVVGFCR